MMKNTPPTIPTTGQSSRLYFKLSKFLSGLPGYIASEIYTSAGMKSVLVISDRIRDDLLKLTSFLPLLISKGSQHHPGDVRP